MTPLPPTCKRTKPTTILNSCSRWTVRNPYGRIFSCSVARWALQQIHFLCPERLLHSAHYCLTWYFIIGKRISKCFPNSKVMLEKQHRFFWWIHYVRTCTADVSSGLATRMTLNITGEVGVVCCTGMDMHLTLYLVVRRTPYWHVHVCPSRF
jgi:hypothetical protein